MCTVSWLHQPDGYHLLCNRDEQRVRGTAFAPRLLEQDGVRYIAPIDSDGGGTWLAVNEFGLALCLLNGGAPVGPARPWRSRGLVIPQLASAQSARKCMQWTKHLDLNLYAPFALVILEPGKPAMLAQWDGSDLALNPAADPHMPLTSSSYDARGVRRSRLNALAGLVRSAGGLDTDVLNRFHCSHGSSPDAYSTCMHRDGAETVSFSRVVVSKDRIQFQYLPGAPCQCSSSEQQILTRAA